MREGAAPECLAGVRVAGGGVEVRRAKSKIFAGIFGGSVVAPKVGRFEILERLGAGGMGIVYAARDPQLERCVALKLVRADVSVSGDREQRLVAEARAMARLSHPNVITVYEAGTCDGQVFIAMELIRGGTLREWLANDTRANAEILGVLAAAGEGLAAAHDAGLVHRDFKPENVLVSSDGRVVVTDFGLAQDTGGAVHADRLLSSSAVISDGRAAMAQPAGISAAAGTTKLAGTPAYMAPEQLRGGTADPRSDQFSWCVTAYEAFAGQRPFARELLEALSLDAQLEPVPPGLPPAVPRKVRLAIAGGLAIQPAGRFPSMRALLVRLRPKRRLWLPLAGALAIGAGAAGVLGDTDDPCAAGGRAVAPLWSADARSQTAEAFARTDMPYAADALARVERELDAYATQWGELDTLACRTQSVAMAGCLERRREQLTPTTQLLANADARTVAVAVSLVFSLPDLAVCGDSRSAAAVAEEAGETNDAWATLDRSQALWRAGRFEDVQAELGPLLTENAEHGARWVARAELLAGRTALSLGDAKPAEEAFGRVLDRAGQGAPLDEVAHAAIGIIEARGLVGSDFDEGLRLIRSADIAAAAAGNPPLVRAALASTRARLLIRAGRPNDGLPYVEEALDVLESLGDHAQLELGDALHLHASLLYRQGQLDASSRLQQRALAVRTDVLGEAHPSIAGTLMLGAALELARGQAKDAVRTFRQAAAIQRTTLGEQHQDYGRALANLGSALRVAGDFEQARAQTEAALAVFLSSLPAQDSRVIATRTNLAAILHEQGEHQAAEEAYRAVLGAQRAALGDEHPGVAITLANLGRLHLERGNPDAARPLLDDALRIRVAALGPDHERSLAAEVTLAEAELMVGDTRRARDMTHRVLRLRTEALGPEHPLVVEVQLLLAKIAIRDADAREALARAQAALDIRMASGESKRLVNTARFFVAQAHVLAGEPQAAGAVARQIALEGPLAGELRGWCASDCQAELAELRGQPAPP